MKKLILIVCTTLLSTQPYLNAQNRLKIEYKKHTSNEFTVKLTKHEEIIIKMGVDIKDKNIKIKSKVESKDNYFAFRYEGNNKLPITIKSELSSWEFPQKTKVWYFERNNSWKLKSYAGTWTSCSVKELSKVSEVGAIQGLPLIFEFQNGVYGLLTEAGLNSYSGMRIEATDSGLLTANFTEEEGFEAPENFVSPWRVLYFAESLNELVNQRIVEKLSPKPDKKLYSDISYIVPGKCAWRWFAKGTGTPSQEREVIDQASKLNFEYTMIDDGWNRWHNAWSEVGKLVSHGKTKNVGVILWKHSHDIMSADNDYNIMKGWLDSVAHYGAVGVKVDFMDSESKKMIDFDIKLLQEAAKRKLLVIFHGCQKPTGEQYTYPNEITREGIRGVELNKMKEGYISAFHNASLPFTRFVVGNGDYTPLTFTVPGETSFAHQLATLVCFTSAFQVIAEDTDLLLTDSHIRPALDFIKRVPTVWDQTIVLEPSKIGELAVIARRRDNRWYIGVLNGAGVAKTITLDLTPLKISSKVSKLKLYVDDISVDKVLLSMQGHRKGQMKRDPSTPFKVECIPFNNNVTLEVAPFGGAVIELF